MTLHRIDVWSAAAVLGTFGFVGGVLYGLSLLSPARSVQIVALTAIGGAMVGAFSGAMQAAIYNIVARYGGSLKIDIHPTSTRSAGNTHDEVRCPACLALESPDSETCHMCGEPLPAGG